MLNNDSVTSRSNDRATSKEADIFGTWFARVGIMAVLIGAAFGFKYAVDEGILSPGLRVLAGVSSGLLLIAWGEWSQQRRWPRLSQAVGGGGIALLYLSVWSAFQLYGLISGAEAFAALTAVAGLGAILSLRHDSMPLAILATVGGFGNAVLIGEGFERPAALFGYVAILDCVVLGLAYVRRWRALDHVALAGTWLLFITAILIASLSSDGIDLDTSLGFATLYFMMFTSIATARRLKPGDSHAGSELVLLGLNTAIYVTTALTLLSDQSSIAGATSEELRGPVILVAAGVQLVAGLLLRRRDLKDPVSGVALGSAVALLAAWGPVALQPFAVPAAWTALAAALIAVAHGTGFGGGRWPGYGLLGLSVVYLAGIATEPSFYDTDRILLTPQAAAFAIQIAGFYVTAWTMRRGDEHEASLAPLVAGAGSMLTVLWLSFEAAGYFSPMADPESLQSFHFTITAIWGIYATALLSVGIWRRAAGARYLAIALFGATVTKLLVHDVWMLETLHRTFVFIGLGAALLASSVLYHRLGDIASPGSSVPSPESAD